MERIAIIGTGIAGMGCAHFLNHRYDITMYEQNNYIGGHTHTITVHEDGSPVFIDTGFMVFNLVTYPNLVRLFKELGVDYKPTSMSFSVQHVPSRLEFNGSGINELFAQRRNLLNPSYIRMLLEINRFNNTCREVIEKSQFADYTLKEYVEEKGYSDDFLMKYLVPMSSAVWSTPPD
ncbi:MAG TPA: NAD(P)-binding protein, partial [bacterium]|nr:NAD(P)-binding protein [bacterium]